MSSLMYALSENESDENNKRIIELGKKILDESNDAGLRAGAIQILCFTSNNIGDTDSAKKYANMMGIYHTTQNELMKLILQGDEAVKYCQNNISALVDLIARNALVMSWEGNYSIEEKIKIFQYCINIYKLVYENEDFGFYACRLSEYYDYIASEYTKSQNTDVCLDALENMAKFAAITDTQPDMKRTSILVDRTESKRDSSTKNYMENDSKLHLNHLKAAQYDFLRDNPRFIEVVSELEKVAN